MVILGAGVGGTVGHEVGRHFGLRGLNLRILRKKRQKLDQARDFLAPGVGRAVSAGRFTAFFRAVMPTMAGLSRTPYRRFLHFNAAGGMAWGAAAVLLGYFAGNAYLTVAKTAGHNVTLIIIGLAAAGLVIWCIQKRRKNRRRPKLNTNHEQSGRRGVAGIDGTSDVMPNDTP